MASGSRRSSRPAFGRARLDSWHYLVSSRALNTSRESCRLTSHFILQSKHSKVSPHKSHRQSLIFSVAFACKVFFTNFRSTFRALLPSYPPGFVS
jgi:hypothetical protein